MDSGIAGHWRCDEPIGLAYAFVMSHGSDAFEPDSFTKLLDAGYMELHVDPSLAKMDLKLHRNLKAIAIPLHRKKIGYHHLFDGAVKARCVSKTTQQLSWVAHFANGVIVNGQMKVADGAQRMRITLRAMSGVHTMELHRIDALSPEPRCSTRAVAQQNKQYRKIAKARFEALQEEPSELEVY